MRFDSYGDRQGALGHRRQIGSSVFKSIPGRYLAPFLTTFRPADTLVQAIISGGQVTQSAPRPRVFRVGLGRLAASVAFIMMPSNLDCPLLIAIAMLKSAATAEEMDS